MADTPGRRSQRLIRIGVVLMLGLAAVARTEGGESERIASLLEARPGAAVADVGAGEGSWTIGLSAAVGPGGRVYATEVGEELVRSLRERVKELDLENVTAVLGAQQAIGLPDSCCDAILLRLVYHHFVDPAMMRSELARSLRPGGRLLVIETVPQSSWRRLEGVPERGGHGIAPDDLVEEMAQAGFVAIERSPEWNGDPERYAIVFRRAGSPRSSE